jgi:hypothetical protein
MSWSFSTENGCSIGKLSSVPITVLRGSWLMREDFSVKGGGRRKPSRTVWFLRTEVIEEEGDPGSQRCVKSEEHAP